MVFSLWIIICRFRHSWAPPLAYRLVVHTGPRAGWAFFATFSSDPLVLDAIEQSAPILLIGGGTFLILLFLHWLFLEQKNYGLRGEQFIASKGVWFFAIASIVLAGIVWLALGRNPMMAFGAVVGSTGFFIVHGFRQNAEEAERNLLQGNMSDLSKIFYLEV